MLEHICVWLARQRGICQAFVLLRWLGLCLVLIFMVPAVLIQGWALREHLHNHRRTRSAGNCFDILGIHKPGVATAICLPTMIGLTTASRLT